MNKNIPVGFFGGVFHVNSYRERLERGKTRELRVRLWLLDVSSNKSLTICIPWAYLPKHNRSSTLFFEPLRVNPCLSWALKDKVAVFAIG